MEFLPPSLEAIVENVGGLAKIEVDLVETIFNISEENKEKTADKIISFLQKEGYVVHIQLVRRVIEETGRLIAKTKAPLNFLIQKINETFNLKEKIRTFSVDRNDVEECVRKDDIETFRDLYNNQNANDVRYDYSYDKKITLLELCALYGAAKCFKFMIANGEDIVNSTEIEDIKKSGNRRARIHRIVNLAIEGGNLEIIRILDQNKMDFYNGISKCFICHRYDVLEWINSYKGKQDATTKNDLMHSLLFDPFMRVEIDEEETRFKKSNKTHGDIKIDMDKAITYYEFPLILKVPNKALTKAVSIAGHGFAGFFQLHSNASELPAIFKEAVFRNHVNVVKFFIDKCGSAAIQNLIDQSQFDALEYNHGEFLEFLINNGANVEARNQEGMPLLYFAIRTSYLDGFKVLLNHGCDVKEPLDDGGSLLHLAVKFCSREIAQFLIDAGLSIKQRNNAGKTPFAIAVEIRDEICMEMMINMKADVNEKVKDGKTALHLEAARGDLYMTKLLFNNGAFTDIKDDFGKTPLDYATDTVSCFLKDHKRSITGDEANEEEKKEEKEETNEEKKETNEEKKETNEEKKQSNEANEEEKKESNETKE